MFCEISKSTVLKSFRLWCPLDANTVKAFTVSNKVIGLGLYHTLFDCQESHCIALTFLLKYNGIYSKTCHFKLKFPEFSGRGIDTSPLGASIESPPECLATGLMTERVCCVPRSLEQSGSITLIHTCSCSWLCWTIRHSDEHVWPSISLNVSM